MSFSEIRIARSWTFPRLLICVAEEGRVKEEWEREEADIIHLKRDAHTATLHVLLCGAMGAPHT